MYVCHLLHVGKAIPIIYMLTVLMHCVVGNQVTQFYHSKLLETADICSVCKECGCAVSKKKICLRCRNVSFVYVACSLGMDLVDCLLTICSSRSFTLLKNIMKTIFFFHNKTLFGATV